MDEILFYAMNIAHSATSYTTSLKTHLLGPLKQYATSQPDLMNIALLLVIVYLSLSILGMASRWIYSVVITTLRLLLFVVIVGGAIWVWQRGPQKSQSDFLKVVKMVNEGVSAAAGGKGPGSGGMGGGGAGTGFERQRYEY
ncbi:hypothetical protein L873DRAFT_1801337 [Choiromyces venosus 120613-1]|uniref:Uncharacterized protein n=1 Tax=Choiromyces venosus 120613-1 TaxID=1336337 RepID=A0A3N4KB80_9PEZI|nr:hypothetical protein L873DRAFT_1801337 [Choiromyces venosus 120613-1]